MYSVLSTFQLSVEFLSHNDVSCMENTKLQLNLQYFNVITKPLTVYIYMNVLFAFCVGERNVCLVSLYRILKKKEKSSKCNIHVYTQALSIQNRIFP